MSPVNTIEIRKTATARSGHGLTLDRIVASVEPKYRQDIDGLRAVAVLSVVGFHCGVPFMSGGFIGVDIFFVISGYLICSIILRDLQQKTFSVARFYERRFKRILPALFAVLAACLIVAILILSPLEAQRLGKSTVATSLSLSNVYFYLKVFGGYFNPNVELNPLLMTWSLAVEEQFYLVFPLLMLALYKLKKVDLFSTIAALSILSLMISIWTEFRQPYWNFYMPVTRAWELGAGTLLAIWEGTRVEPHSVAHWKKNVMGVVGVAMIVACLFLYKPGMRFPGFEAVPPVLGTVLLLGSAGGFAGRILAIRPLAAIGLISYSLYLWHWPLLSFARILSPVSLPPRVSAILMTLAFAAAIFSYHFIEKPFRSAVYSNRRNVLLWYGAVIVCFALLGGCFYLTRGFSHRAPELDRIETNAGVERYHPCLTDSDEPVMRQECVPAAALSSRTIALLGDSHAEVLKPAVEHFASTNRFRLVVLTKSSCPPLQGMSPWHPPAAISSESCKYFNKQVLAYIEHRPDIDFVFLAGRWDNKFLPDGNTKDPVNMSAEQSALNLRQGLQLEIAALESMGKRVIVMDDVPALPFDPMRAARYNRLPVRRVFTTLLLGRPLDNSGSITVKRSDTTTAGDDLASMNIASLKASDRNLIVIDPKAAFCNQEICTFADAANVYYSDQHHLSSLGALRLVPMLQEILTIARH